MEPVTRKCYLRNNTLPPLSYHQHHTPALRVAWDYKLDLSEIIQQYVYEIVASLFC